MAFMNYLLLLITRRVSCFSGLVVVGSFRVAKKKICKGLYSRKLLFFERFHELKWSFHVKLFYFNVSLRFLYQMKEKMRQRLMCEVKKI